MNREAPTDINIHTPLVQRWSPYSFDPERAIKDSDLRALFEAARWTMSSYNEQPWRYIVGIRERKGELWGKVLNVIVSANQVWAKNAPVLVLGIAEHLFEYNGKENKAAIHDLGAASANLTVEATVRGISVHQMIGIDPDRAREEFDLNSSQEPLTALAIGYIGDPSVLDEEYANRDLKVRERKSIKDILIHCDL